MARFEPATMWQPYEPSASQPWNFSRVAHLYRRAAFGGTRGEIEAGLKQQPSEIIDQLLAKGEDTSAFDRQMASLASTAVSDGEPEKLTAWWLYRMLHTPAPLLEKLTLFWHGHFATSAAKVTSGRLMLAQNELLRKLALGRFEEMVQAMSRDPAMLIYLDSTTNRKSHPNENYAREVMELFSLGLDAYTEKDIQELARAFTGWEVRREKFHFNPYQHDRGVKRLLGIEGNFGGEEGVRIVLSQDAAPRFIARKLVRFFVLDEPALSDEQIQPLADDLRANDFRIEPTLRKILTSQFFYSNDAMARIVRSPVDLAVGLVRSLEGSTSTTNLTESMRPLGQLPFYPPSVKGWDAGRTYVNATTLLGRANLVRDVVTHDSSQFAGGTLADLAQKHGMESAQATVDRLCEQLLATPLPNTARLELIELAEKRRDDRAVQLAGVIHALSTQPEFQLA